MKHPSAVFAALVSIAAAASVRGQDEERPKVTLSGVAEVRFAHTGDAQSWLEGGLGKTRYGALEGRAANLLTVPLLALVTDASFQETFTAHVQLNLDAEPDAALNRGRVGLTEGYLGYRNDLTPKLRLRLRGGLFWPPISLENGGPAWTTTYTITPSAANSWVGEELRTAGVEGRLALLSGEHEAWLTAAAFGANDPAGTLLLWRGWALHDRQTTVGEKLPLPAISSIGPGRLFQRQAPWDSPVREVDGRIGYYAGAGTRLAGRLDLSGLRYDNRADPISFDRYQYGWATRFWNGSARLRLSAGLELLGQYLSGDTAMGPIDAASRHKAEAGFEAWYVLATAAWGALRLSARYDRFSSEDRDAFVLEDDNNEHGDAWTGAAVVKAGHLQLIGEWLHVDSERPFRADLKLPVQAKEDLVQLSARFAF